MLSVGPPSSTDVLPGPLQWREDRKGAQENEEEHVTVGGISPQKSFAFSVKFLIRYWEKGKVQWWKKKCLCISVYGPPPPILQMKTLKLGWRRGHCPSLSWFLDQLGPDSPSSPVATVSRSLTWKWLFCLPPASRAKLSMINTMSKIRGQEKGPGYPQAEALLAEAMLKFGRELGDDCNFGNECSLACPFFHLSTGISCQ